MNEQDEATTEEDGFNLSEELVPAPRYIQAQTTTVDFDGLLKPGLVLHTDPSKGNGGTTWPAGETLAKYLLRKKRDALKNSTMSVRTQGCIHFALVEPLTSIVEWSMQLQGQAWPYRSFADLV